MAANHPLRHAALSADGEGVAVAGTRGLALYSRRSGRWRLFGDVSQERQIEVQVWRARAAASCTPCTHSGAWRAFGAIFTPLARTLRHLAPLARTLGPEPWRTCATLPHLGPCGPSGTRGSALL